MLSLDADKRIISLTKPMKLGDLEMHLKTFRRVYKDLDEWTIIILPSGGVGEPSEIIPEEGHFKKPEMPPLDVTSSDLID